MDLTPLKPGDTVELVAPSGRCDAKVLEQIAAVLKSWGLNCVYPKNIFGKDLLCANSHKLRLQHLQHALTNPKSQAVWCLRGGYGATQLLPDLLQLTSPARSKWFIGFSDATALHLFLNQYWHWQTIHGPSARQVSSQKIDEISIVAMRNVLLTAETPDITDLTPVNAAARQAHTVKAEVTGGNLCLVQCSLGTPWQIDPTDKIVLLEEVNERAYCVERSLTHLLQAGVFERAKAVLLGEFSGGEEQDGTNQTDKVLQRFADSLSIPVLRTHQVGHEQRNLPVWLNRALTLQLGNKPALQQS